ncbi:hypothetical protein Trydic_g20790 [Trypoxylus dichotomus]
MGESKGNVDQYDTLPKLKTKMNNIIPPRYPPQTYFEERPLLKNVAEMKWCIERKDIMPNAFEKNSENETCSKKGHRYDNFSLRINCEPKSRIDNLGNELKVRSLKKAHLQS